MDTIDEEEVRSREVDLVWKKRDKGITKLVIFDLDETLAHCVRQENPERPPDVRLDINM
jgi:hypothetical protein